MHHVDAEIAGAGDPNDRVEVGAVHVKKRAVGVERVGHFVDPLLEEAERVGIGHHRAGHVFADLALEILDVDEPVGAGLHRDRPQTRDRARGGIGAMGRIGDEDHVAVLSAILEIRLAYQQCGELPLGAGARVERHPRQAGHLR